MRRSQQPSERPGKRPDYQRCAVWDFKISSEHVSQSVNYSSALALTAFRKHALAAQQEVEERLPWLHGGGRGGRWHLDDDAPLSWGRVVGVRPACCVVPVWDDVAAAVDDLPCTVHRHGLHVQCAVVEVVRVPCVRWQVGDVLALSLRPAETADDTGDVRCLPVASRRPTRSGGCRARGRSECGP